MSPYKGVRNIFLIYCIRTHYLLTRRKTYAPPTLFPIAPFKHNFLRLLLRPGFSSDMSMAQAYTLILFTELRRLFTM